MLFKEKFGTFGKTVIEYFDVKQKYKKEKKTFLAFDQNKIN